MNAEPTTTPTRDWPWSYAAIPVMLILTGMLHLGVLVLAILFSYFALALLRRAVRGRKWAAVGAFVVLAAAILYGAGYFVREAVLELPDIVDSSVPAIVEWARQHQIAIPFTDYDSLKELVISTAKSEIHYAADVARLARGAAAQLALLGIGIIVAIAKFLHSAPKQPTPAGTLNEAACRDMSSRFAIFYECFATMMGAQIAISAVNTTLTGIYVAVAGLPHAVVIVGITFLFGLLPVVGNLISNSIMVCIAFTVSPKEALAALIFLVVIHKLEYFLNSKIIGSRISQPIWLTLLALVVGEKLMGVTGMILAPVVLFYFRSEAARIPAESTRIGTN